MGHFKQSTEIHAPISACFDEWMKFEEFPRFMNHVKSVTKLDNNLWHWIVEGPVGSKVEWDAQMDGKMEDRMISWNTVGDSMVDNQGAVVFEEIGPNTTRVTSTFQYEPPAGPIGELVATIFSNPETMVKQDLDNFKQLMEVQYATSSSSY